MSQGAIAPRPGSRANKREGGLPYGGNVVGKHRFRVRERHVAEHLVPLMTRKCVGAAKLDVVLRGVALLPRDAGKREPGLVLPRYSWEELHDLARVPNTLGSAPADSEAGSEVRRLKRKWVGEQLARLEDLQLLRREPGRGGRPRLTVLRDDGSGSAFDDPDGTPGNSYLTISGAAIASGALASWGVPELSFYLAAMVAERYSEDMKRRGNWPLDSNQWFRPLGWFRGSGARRPRSHVLIPFSVPTLERGLAALEEAGLVSRERITQNPQNGRRLSGPRNLYRNQFVWLDIESSFIDPSHLT